MKKYNLLILLLLPFLLTLSCKSKKKQVREKFGVEEKKDGKKAKHEPTLAEIFADDITVDDLDYHVHNLAEDSLKGRETGSRGQKIASKYIKDFFVDEQVSPFSDVDGYYQKFTATENNLPEVTLKTDFTSYKFGEDFISFFPHNKMTFNDKNIIYAGYGIEDVRYNDYAYRDVKNKIVLIRGGEPKDKYGNHIISGGRAPSDWSKDPIHSYILKRNAAQKHGARILLIYDPERKDYFWENFEKKFKTKKLSVSVKKDSVYDFFINKKMFVDLTGYETPDEMSYTKRTRKLTVPLEMTYHNSSQVVESENVIGIIEGGEKKDEYITIISHFDGQGVKKGEIYPSANDNASGVAAGFEILEAFRTAIDSGFVPRRSIVFVNLSGHEQDMLGAKFYATHPVVPLNKTIAVIELHKLGRLRDVTSEESIYPLRITFDGFDATGFKKAVNKIQAYNDHMQLKFNSDYENSDYIQFKKKKIPVIYFHGRNFPDYHTPNDTADKISYDILEKRTRFIFQIIWDIVNQKKI